AHHRIQRGLDLPIDGAPVRLLESAPEVTRVALLADDYPGLAPRMLVHEGDVVRRGQPLFEDRHATDVRFVAPGAGRVIGVHRGERRSLRSVVIHLGPAEREGEPGPEHLMPLESHAEASSTLDREAL